jgi:6-pyruvoyltetrahydropterin/6-carboxytetrahydropterin synthase
MRAELVKTLAFEAAHRLPRVPAGHKCARLHGHSFQVEIRVGGEVDQEMGWVCDYEDLKVACAPLLEQLDHHYLNEVPGLDNPTSENIAQWIWVRLVGTLPGLLEVTVQETCTSRCTYRGDQPTSSAHSRVQ